MTYQTLNFDTEIGVMEFEGIPVSNDFDYQKFAIENGFTNLHINEPDNTKKYAGVGFVVYKNFNDSSDIAYYLKKRLEILFVNGLPVAYSISPK